jgi:hypothetical protein
MFRKIAINFPESDFVFDAIPLARTNESKGRPITCRWTFCLHGGLLEYRQSGVQIALSEKLVSQAFASITP